VTTTTAGRRFRIGPIITAVVLTVLLLWLLGATADIFLLLFIGILISLYLSAVTDFFERRLRIPRQLAFTLALLVTIAAVVGLFWLLVPPVILQTQQLVRVLPNYITTWETGIENAIKRVPGLTEMWQTGEHRLLRAAYEQISLYFQDLVPKVVGIGHAIINIFSVMVMGIYLSLYPGAYREWLIALFPPIHRDLVRDVLSDLGHTLRAWIVGQLFAMFILAVLTAIGLYLLQVPYWLTFGIFTGVVALVPFFGTLVSTLLPALFVLGGDGFAGFSPVTHAALVALLGVVIHVLEGNLVAPVIMSAKVKLPPVLTILSVLIFGKLLGPVGLLVAVPALAAIMVIIRRILLSRIYEGTGFRRTTRDRVLVLRVPVPQGDVLLPEGSPPDVVTEAERADLAARRIA
jgi:predicted PurR-regulated permease PerM